MKCDDSQPQPPNDNSNPKQLKARSQIENWAETPGTKGVVTFTNILFFIAWLAAIAYQIRKAKKVPFLTYATIPRVLPHRTYLETKDFAMAFDSNHVKLYGFLIINLGTHIYTN